MAYAAGGASAAAAAAAAIANATKASGAIVKMNPDQFEKLVMKQTDLVVVVAESGLFSKKLNYLTNYKGLFIYTKSDKPVRLPGRAEIIHADNIWIPG